MVKYSDTYETTKKWRSISKKYWHWGTKA